MADGNDLFNLMTEAADAKALAAARAVAEAARTEEIQRNSEAAQEFLSAFTEGRIGRSIEEIVAEALGGDEPPAEAEAAE